MVYCSILVLDGTVGGIWPTRRTQFSMCLRCPEMPRYLREREWALTILFFCRLSTNFSLQEGLLAAPGSKGLGLTRDQEQFTGHINLEFRNIKQMCSAVMILTYNRDAGVKKIIEKLRFCPYLNKVNQQPFFFKSVVFF